MEISNLLSVTLRKNPDFDPKQVDMVKVEQQVQALLESKGAGDVAMINGKELSLFGSDGVLIKGIYQVIDEKDMTDDYVDIITTCYNITDDELIGILLNSVAEPPQSVRAVYVGATTTQPLRFNFFGKVPDSAAGAGGSGGTGGSDPSGDPLDPPSGGGSGSDPTGDPLTPPGGAGTGGDGSGPDAPTTVNYTLTRKNAGGGYNSKTITVTSGVETTVKLTNSIDGSEYYYVITATSGTQTVKLEFLDNNRFLIVGSGIEITACDGQDDDIILIGSNNILNTNSGNDTVRVGGTNDTNNYFISTAYGYTFEGGAVNGGFNQYNTINTGSGDDYISIIGMNNIIDAGDDNDTYFRYWNDYPNIYSNGEYEFEYDIGSSDKNLGWASQGQYGDCKLLSFLNSFWASGQNLGDYVEIEKSGSNYKVTFKNANVTPNSYIVTPSDFNDDPDPYGNPARVIGDLDNVLVEIALRKLIVARGYSMTSSGDNSFGATKNNFLIAQYFFGSSMAVYVPRYVEYEGSTPTFYNDNFENEFIELLNAYNEGTISNLTAGTVNSNNKIGIINNHAYSIVGGVAGSYVLVSNPHDGNDIIKLDWSDFMTYFGYVLLYGDSSDYAIDHDFFNMLKSEDGANLSWYNYTGSSVPRFNSSGHNDDPEIVTYELNQIQQYIDIVKDMMNIERKFELYS